MAVFSVGFVVVMLVLLFRELPEAAARTATLAFLALPVAMTSFYWIGMDSITLFLLALALLLRRHPVPVAIVGVLLGMNHWSQAGAAAAALGLAVLISALMRLRPWRDLLFPVALLAGVLIGRLVLQAIFDLAQVDLRSDRVGWAGDNLGGLLHDFAFAPLLIIFGVFALGWLVVVRYGIDRGRGSWPLFIPLIGLCLTLLVFTGDRTRVLSIATLPLVAGYLLLDERFITGIAPRTVVWFAIAWFVVPWIWVWGMTAETSVIGWDAQFLLSFLPGGVVPPVPFTMSPFP